MVTVFCSLWSMVFQLQILGVLIGPCYYRQMQCIYLLWAIWAIHKWLSACRDSGYNLCCGKMATICKRKLHEHLRTYKIDPLYVLKQKIQRLYVLLCQNHWSPMFLIKKLAFSEIISPRSQKFLCLDFKIC